MTSKLLKNNILLRRGFTLLEALVAISIIMIAVTSPITIAQKGLSSAVYSKDQMVGAYLAQDAIEFIKNKRDEATINNSFRWDTFLDDFQFCLGTASQPNPNGCSVDTVTGTDSEGEVVQFNSSLYLKKNGNNFYGHEADVSKPDNGVTKFRRQINMFENPTGQNQDEILVTVKVSWGDITNDEDKNNVVIKTLLYNY